MTLVAWALAGLAHGKCAQPGVFVGGDGETVPPDPVLWVFIPGEEQKIPRVAARDGEGNTVPAQIERAPSAPQLQVWKIAVDTSREGAHALEVRWDRYGYEASMEASFKVSEAWKAPEQAPSVRDVGVTDTMWTCSYQSTRDLEVRAANAVAFELVWAASEREFARGEVQTMVLPTHPELRWDPRQASRSSGQRIELGHLDCTGDWFEWRHPTVWLGVRALYADGSRSEAQATAVVAAPPTPAIKGAR